MNDTDIRSGGLFWWGRSVLVALGVAALEWVAAVTVQGIEFAGKVTPFVAVALVAALAIDPLLIFFWVRSRAQIPPMRSPLALPIFGVLLCAPLLLSEHLAFQAALGAPTVLGFLLPGIMDVRTR
jgi:hypothetical protein